MIKQWFDDCDTEDEKLHRRNLIADSQKILDILSKICYNSIDNAVLASGDYSLPGWDGRLAHRQGKIEAYKDIVRLCQNTLQIERPSQTK